MIYYRNRTTSLVISVDGKVMFDSESHKVQSLA